jgi:hypothetical protein
MACLPAHESFSTSARSVPARKGSQQRADPSNCTAAGAQVLSLQPARDASGAVSHCDVELSDGRVVQARRVLVAIGSTNMQRLPEFAQRLQPPGQQQPAAAAGCSVVGAGGLGDGSSCSGHGRQQPGMYSCTKVGGNSTTPTSCTGAGASSSRPSLPTGRVMHAWEVASSFACIRQQLQQGAERGRTSQQVSRRQLLG